jgi:hypothetical protein
MGRYPVLELPEGQLGAFAKPRRLAAIQEAISWPVGPSRDQQVSTVLFEHTDARGFHWQVVLSKPGKEAFLTQRRNVNDMFPRVLRDGVDINYGESFAGIWDELENIGKSASGSGAYALELIARFVIAAAYTVAHEEVDEGIWRVSPGPEMQKFYDDLESLVLATTVIQGNVPLRVFLNLIEAIALQEDVKYFTRDGGVYPGVKGRENNLKTTAGVIRYLAGGERISWLVGRLSSQPPGVLNMTQTFVRQYFPPLQ